MKPDSYSAFARRAVELAAFAAAVVVLSCADPAGPGDTVAGEATLAKGGGGSGQVTVSAAKPDTGTQGTTLDVTISGSGFTSDMAATWELDGVADPTQVRTNSTRYVSSKQLVANVTIAEGATVAKWDVRVTSSRCCKGGIGIELFEVKLRPNDPDYTSTWEFYGQTSDGSPTAINGDGRAADGVNVLSASGDVTGVYSNAACGVKTRLFVPDFSGSGSGDATIDPDADWGKGLKCDRRYFEFRLTPSQVIRSGAFTNALDVWGTETVGETAMGWVLGLRDCERLIFGDRDFIAIKEGRLPVRITHLDDGASPRRWIIESQPPHAARCVVWKVGEYVWTGPVYTLPFRIRIAEVRNRP